MNITLRNAANKILLGLLKECNEDQKLLFIRMYSKDNTNLSIEDVVNNMTDNKIDWAITQCENTIKRNSNEQ